MLATERLRKYAGRFVFPSRHIPPQALLTDLHLHTVFTDGRSSVLEMLKASADAKLSAVAFTEHVRRGICWFGDFRREVEREREAFPCMNVLIGIEAKALNHEGELDADEPMIREADLVLGAFHHYPDGHGGFVSHQALAAEEAAQKEFEASWALLDNPHVDVLAHPSALTRKHFGTFPDAFLELLVWKAACVGRAVELNGQYFDPPQLQQLLTWCRDAGAWVTLGSNAHHAAEVGKIGQLLNGGLARAY